MSIKGINNPPSAEHLVKLIGSNPEATAKNIIDFRLKKIPFNLSTPREFLVKFFGGADYDLLMTQAGQLRNDYSRAATLEILPLGKQFLEEFRPAWFKPVGSYHYALSKSIIVPLKPFGLMAIDGQILGIFAPLWKNIGLNVEQFRIWASLMKEGYLPQNPDVDNFFWLEMSAPKIGAARELAVRDMETVDFLTELEFAGVRMNIEAAMKIVASVPKEKIDRKRNPQQPDFFPPGD